MGEVNYTIIVPIEELEKIEDLERYLMQHEIEYHKIHA